MLIGHRRSILVLARGSCSSASRQQGQPPGRAAAHGLYPPPVGVSDIQGLEVAGWSRVAMPLAMAAAGIQPGDRVCALGGWWRLCTVLRGSGRDNAGAGAQGSMTRPRACPETFLHRLEQRGLIARLRAGETHPGSGWFQRHRRDRDPVGQAAGATVIVTAGRCQVQAACIGLAPTTPSTKLPTSPLRCSV